MALSLDRELEELVAEEVRSGRFESAEALVGAALRHYFSAREQDEILRAQLEEANAEIDAGLSIEIEDDAALSAFFQEIWDESMDRLKQEQKQ